MKKLMTQPINLIYRYLINENHIKIKFKNRFVTIYGKIIVMILLTRVLMNKSYLIDNHLNTKDNIGLVIIKGQEISEIYKTKDN
uniref:mRNA splicing protein n=1 Tax=Amorphochlora amoebiformis TaxID=1561963 RepID=A0A0H5BHV6_9EUKA|nr:mRNA splicing protein [Amorphochlora amoebiformis]